jgi:Acetyltransferases
MKIISLDPKLKRKAAAVIAASFYDYPMFTFYFPNPAERSRDLPWYLGNVLNCALRYGEVYTTPELSGVLFTLPPGHTRISLWEYILNGFLPTPLRMGTKKYAETDECEAFVGDIHEEIMQSRPHYYLWGLAIDPQHKRTGVGTALLQPVLAKADAEKLPFYLETHDERNVAYYQRFGFTLARATVIPKYGLDVYCMVREAAA